MSTPHEQRLLEDWLYPVVSPKLAPPEAPLTPGRLAELPLIEQVWEGRPADWPVWEDWCAVAGIAPFAPSSRHRFNIFAHGVQAALAGQGVLLAHHALVADDVAAEILLRLFAAAVPSPYAFHLVRGSRRTLAQRALVDWLVAQCRTEGLPGDAVPPLTRR